VKTLLTTLLKDHTLALEERQDDGPWTFFHVRTKKSVSVEASTLEAEVAAAEDPRAWLSSFLEGLTAVLCRRTFRLPEMSFADAAGGLLPRLMGPGFVAGVQRAGVARPYARQWEAGLVLTYWVELDDGLELLTRENVEAWAVTDDRIACAGRSMLFHKTGFDCEETRASGGVRTFSRGDGYDTARILALADLEWHRAQTGLLAAVPREGLMLYSERPTADTDAAWQSFKATVLEEFSSSSRPLSPHLFELVKGQVRVL